LLGCAVLLLTLVRAAPAAVLTGTVIGEGAHPVAGAMVQVVRAQPACEGTTAADGTFSLACAVILNRHMPAVGERVTPLVVAGARGASASVSYGADEIARALAARRHGVVFAALVIAPGCFALFSLGLATAIMVVRSCISSASC